MFIRIRGVQHYLWRAVDQDGVVLDVLVQSRRNTKAAKRFFRGIVKLTWIGRAKTLKEGKSTFYAALRTHVSCFQTSNAWAR